MKHTIQTLAWALLVGHALTASAQAPLQREEAVALALEQNLGVQIARLNVELAEVNDAWGAAGALPQIGLNTNLSGAVSDQSENPTSFIQERLESQSVSIGGQLNWVVFDGLGMFANRRALETLVEQADGQARLIIEQTIAATLQAYDAVRNRITGDGSGQETAVPEQCGFAVNGLHAAIHAGRLRGRIDVPGYAVHRTLCHRLVVLVDKCHCIAQRNRREVPGMHRCFDFIGSTSDQYAGQLAGSHQASRPHSRCRHDAVKRSQNGVLIQSFLRRTNRMEEAEDAAVGNKQLFPVTSKYWQFGESCIDVHGFEKGLPRRPILWKISAQVRQRIRQELQKLAPLSRQSVVCFRRIQLQHDLSFRKLHPLAKLLAPKDQIARRFGDDVHAVQGLHTAFNRRFRNAISWINNICAHRTGRNRAFNHGRFRFHGYERIHGTYADS